MQYSQTLIAQPQALVPSAKQVEVFLSAMVAKGVVPEPPTLLLRTPSDRTREIWNPFTKAMQVMKLKDRKELDGIAQIANAIGVLTDYEIEVAGTGRPTTPPIPIEFDEPYYLAVTCFVSSALCSTSDWHDDLRGEPTVPFYGEPCDKEEPMGFFSDPHSGRGINIAGAGCARFWIQFELGKFLFPQLKNDDLSILHPTVVKEARRTFGIPFVQGCSWG